MGAHIQIRGRAPSPHGVCRCLCLPVRAMCMCTATVSTGLILRLSFHLFPCSFGTLHKLQLCSLCLPQPLTHVYRLGRSCSHLLKPAGGCPSSLTFFLPFRTVSRQVCSAGLFMGKKAGTYLTLESTISCQFTMEMMQAGSLLVKMIAGETMRSLLSHASLVWLGCCNYASRSWLSFVYFWILNNSNYRKKNKE